MKIQSVTPLVATSYPMLRLLLEAHLEHWQEIAGTDIYAVGDRRVKEQAELLSDIFNEIARRL